MKNQQPTSLFQRDLVMEAIKQSFVKLDPRIMVRNPVMFTVEVGTAVMLVVSLWLLFSGDASQGSLGNNITIFLLLLLHGPAAATLAAS